MFPAPDAAKDRILIRRQNLRLRKRQKRFRIQRHEEVPRAK